KQGRVQPTLQLKGVAINADAGLEREADAMGAAAWRIPATASPVGLADAAAATVARRATTGVAQLGAMVSGQQEPTKFEWDPDEIVEANRDAFNMQQEVHADRKTLVAACIDQINDLTDLTTLWELREYIDALVPVFSDAV